MAKIKLRISVQGYKLNLEGYPMHYRDKSEGHNKKVIVEELKKGIHKRVSDLIYGKQKKEFVLEDGDYVGIDEVEKAINEALEQAGEEAYIVDSKGEKVDIKDIVDVVLEASDKIKIKGKSEKITNQDSREWETKTKEQDDYLKKGVAFLGNDGVQLPCGEYINEDDLKKAIEEYAIFIPEPDPPVPPPPAEKSTQYIGDKSEPDLSVPLPEEEHHVVTKVTKLDKFKIKAVIAATVALVALSGFSKENNTEQQQVGMTNPVYEQTQTMDYEASEVVDMDDEINGIVENVINSIGMGETVHVSNGTNVYLNMNEEGKQTFGENGFKSGGDYTVTGFAVKYLDSEGNSHSDYIENFDNSDMYGDLGEFIDNFCTENGIDREEATVMLHLGVTDQDRAGWVDVSDIINAQNLTPEDIQLAADKGATYSGTANVENGSVTLKIDGQDVTFDVNSVKQGDSIEVNGTQYEIGSLQLNTDVQEVAPAEPIYEDVTTGKKLNWSLKDCNFSIALFGAAIAGLIKAAQKAKNDKSKKNPLFFSFENEEKMNEFLDGVFVNDEEESKETITQMLKRWLVSEKQGEAKKYSDEEIKQLVEIVYKDTRGVDERVQDGNIVFRNGKILYVPGPVEDHKTPRSISQETKEKIAEEIEGTKVRDGRLSEKGGELHKDIKNSQSKDNSKENNEEGRE